MYMIQNTNILIAKLKQFPRHKRATQGEDPKDPKQVKKAISESQAKTARTTSELNDLKKGIEGMTITTEEYWKTVQALNTANNQLGIGISKLTADFESYAGKMIAYVKEATYLEQRNASLNKSFGITSAKAAQLGVQYDNLTEAFEAGGHSIRKYAENVNKMLPGMASIIANNEHMKTSLLGANQVLTEHLGLSEDQSNAYQLYAAGAGKSALEMVTATKAMTDGMESSTKMTGLLSMALKDVADLGADIQMTYKRFPGQLEKSVIKAKVLGTTFEKIEAMATKMLDIETSVTSELEYQLLSGKRLVDQDGDSITEKLRIAKLSGNAKDMTEAMNDILTTQGDILEGNNHYAKQELANLTGYSIDELQRMKQTRALLKQGGKGMSDEDINKILSMDGQEFEQAISKMDASQASMLQTLKESASQQTTDEKFAKFMEKERDQGLKVMLGGFEGQVGQITGAAQEVKAGQGQIAKTGTQFMTPEMAAIIGSLQAEGALLKAAKDPVSLLAEKLPGVNTALKSFNETIDEIIDALYGSPDATTGKGGFKSGGGASGKDLGQKEDDAMIVNDGLIQFHPADKFAAIPDGAALLASTSTGALEGSVDKLMSGGRSAVVDPTPIATAVAIAIREAMAGINIIMSGEKLNKAMEFDNRTING